MARAFPGQDRPERGGRRPLPRSPAGQRGIGSTAPGGIPPAVRERIAQSFTRGEDVLYIGLGVLLAAGAVVLLVDGSLAFGRQLLAGTMPGPIIDLLDRALLAVMIMELRGSRGAFGQAVVNATTSRGADSARAG